MQVTSYAALALGQSLRDLVFHPSATPDTAQRPQGGVVPGDNALGQRRRIRDTSPEPSDHAQQRSDHALHRMERLGRLLHRLMASASDGPKTSGVLVAGQARSSSGVAVSIPSERACGACRDMLRVQNSWMRFHGTVLADTVAIVSARVGAVDTGDDADGLALRVDGVATGDGADVINERSGLAPVLPDDDALDSPLPETVEDRMLTAVSTGLQVVGGAGSDTTAVALATPIGLSGGSGDNVPALNNGMSGLFYVLGDGDDMVALGAGTEALVQISDNIGPYMVQIGADILTLTFATGSITFAGLATSGAIGLRAGDGDVMFLHPGAATGLSLLT